MHAHQASPFSTFAADTDRDAGGPEFSIVLGGPLYQLFRRLHIVRESLGLLGRRIIFISLLAWLPLLVLTVIGGRAWGGVKHTFATSFRCRC
jgi:hypothetical protein